MSRKEKAAQEPGFEDAQRIFSRRSRDSARQALWFLGFLQQTGSKAAEKDLESYAEFAVRQVYRIILNVSGARDGTKYMGQIPPTWERIKKQARALAHSLDAEEQEAAGGDPDDASPERARAIAAERSARFYASVNNLARMLRQYIREWPEDNWILRVLGYRFDAIAKYLRKNLATMISFLIVFAVLTQAEMIRSLVLSHGPNVTKALVVLLVPWILIRVFISMKRGYADESPESKKADDSEASEESANFLERTNRPPGRFLLQFEIGMHAFNMPFSNTREPDRLIKRWPKEHWNLLARIFKGRLIKASMMFGLVLLGVGFLNAANEINSMWFPDSVMTLYLIFLLLSLVVIGGRIIDFCEYIFPAPVRMAFLIIALIVAALVLLGYGTVSFAVISLLIALGSFAYWWTSGVDQRIEPLAYTTVFLGISLACFFAILQNRDAAWEDPPVRVDVEPRSSTIVSWPLPSNEDPIVVMAASGGGSRSAVYTAKVLRALYWDDVLFRNEAIKSNESAIWPVACNLQAISGVSGGSLATGAFVSRLYASAGDGPVTSCREAVEQRKACLQDLENLMALDFVLPTLKGALMPFTSRGESIEEFWGRRSLEVQQGCRPEGMGLGKIRVSDLADIWDRSVYFSSETNHVAGEGDDQRDALPAFPIPLFNTTTLEGHNLVISPMASEKYRPWTQRKYAQDYLQRPFAISVYEAQAESLGVDPQDVAWVYHRDAIYGLDDLLPSFDPTLAKAIRASANFPFGFPVIRIKPNPEMQLQFSPKPHQEYIRLTDGGALSNSGLWSLSQLLLYEPVPDDSQDSRSDGSENESQLDKLKRRGVLLIIVEASRMPIYDDPEGTTKLLIGTLNEQAAIAQRMHNGMLDLLVERFGHRIGVVQIDLTPTKNYNVLTTWALDSDALAALSQSFDRQWPHAREKILYNWQALKDGDSRNPPTIDRERPPVD